MANVFDVKDSASEKKAFEQAQPGNEVYFHNSGDFRHLKRKFEKKGVAILLSNKP